MESPSITKPGRANRGQADVAVGWRGKMVAKLDPNSGQTSVMRGSSGQGNLWKHLNAASLRSYNMKRKSLPRTMTWIPQYGMHFLNHIIVFHISGNSRGITSVQETKVKTAIVSHTLHLHHSAQWHADVQKQQYQDQEENHIAEWRETLTPIWHSLLLFVYFPAVSTGLLMHIGLELFGIHRNLSSISFCAYVIKLRLTLGYLMNPH